MSEEARKAKAEYMRTYLKEWRRKNPGKVRGYQRKYWEKKFNESEG